MFQVRYFKRIAEVRYAGTMIGLIVYLAKCSQHYAYNLNLESDNWHFCDTYEQAISEVQQMENRYEIVEK